MAKPLTTAQYKSAMRVKDALERIMYFSENEPVNVQEAILQMAVIAAAQFAKGIDYDLTQKVMEEPRIVTPAKYQENIY